VTDLLDRQLVCYSLAYRPGVHCAKQWVQSIRSLRQHNRDVPVVLCLYGDRRVDLIEREADRQRVQIVWLGDFETSLRHPRAAQLALYPTWGKLLSLRHAPAADRLLYLDCDTYFFDDVALLFDLHQDADWYARDEVLSRRGYPHHYDPAYLDEDELKVVAAMVGASFIAPFNTGVCLMRRWALERFLEQELEFLDFGWRLAAGIVRQSDPAIDDKIWSVLRTATQPEDLARALPYPSSNRWIVEEVATWLVLGRVPGLTTAPLLPSAVPQSNEYRQRGFAWSPVVAHYFSGGEVDFFSLLPRLS
jgi:hypothetical protein